MSESNDAKNSISQSILDVRRLLCPMPVIRLQDKIRQLQAGDMVQMLCTDPGVLQDVPAWCRVHGHEVVSTEQRDREIIIVVRV